MSADPKDDENPDVARPGGWETTGSCYRCHRALPLEAFGKDRTKASGHASICRACDNEKALQYYYANREAVKARISARAAAIRDETYVRRTGRTPVRVVGPVKCSTCMVEYQPRRHDSHYCSEACRNKRPRQRDKAKERARDRARSQQRQAYFRARSLRNRFGSDALVRTAQALAAHTPEPTPLMLSAGPAVEAHAPAARVDDRPEQQRFVGGTCAECGDVFVALSLRRVQYCTEQCASKAQRRVAKQRRRARIRAVESEPIKLGLVANRDGWRCHLCKRTVTRKTWSLDHLIPLSDGGPHTYVNVALAHHWCNSRRSNTGAAQLRLSAA